MLKQETELLLNQRYEITAEIAAGSDCTIYKGHDHLRRLPVLLKAYTAVNMQDWKRFQLMEREAKILAQINHLEIPDFIDFFSVGLDNPVHYLVTEWISGETLQHKLESGWQPTLDEVLDIAANVLALLVYIHAFNPPIVHRDIKPSNLIMGAYQRVFLIDFGGVQELLESQGAGGSTLVGTMGYMPLEQLQGRAVPATDLYALGVTLVQLLTRQSPEELFASSPELKVKDCLPELPERLQRWLQLLVAPHLEQRYGDARVALEDLYHVREQDFSKRSLFYPGNHQARLPEILHSLTLIERSEEDRTLRPGSLLKGRFEVGQLLGSGTHSRVYAGLALASQQPVVIKELTLENIDNWKNLELFEREITTQSQLHHPQIPRFVEAFQVEEGKQLNWYLVTEAVNGQTLEKKLESGWRPANSEVWQLALQVLEILDYLHGCTPALVHRDLKPSNLLLAENKIYLIDFGAVQNRFWAQGGGGSTIIGTFGYMAPEQFSGQASPQSDLYGLGATLVRLLSGRHPIEIPLEASGLHFEPFVNIEAFYCAWLSKLLQPQPQERFVSAAEARQWLLAYLNNENSAQQWLKRQQKASQPVTTASRHRRVLPARLPLEKAPRFLEQADLEFQATDQQLQIQLPADRLLRKTLSSSKFHFQNLEGELLLIALGGITLVMGLAILAVSLSDRDYSWLTFELGLIAGGLLMTAGGGYLSSKRVHFPIKYADFDPNAQSHNKQTYTVPPPRLVLEGQLTLSPGSISLRNHNLPGKVEQDNFNCAWSNLDQIELKALELSETMAEKWQGHADLPLFELSLTLRQPQRDRNGFSFKAYECLLPLATADGELLSDLLSSLHRQYAPTG